MRLRNIPGARDVIAESPFVVQEPERAKGAWHALFQNDRPIRIEVGMGKGKFLLEMAALHPEINWIGIEMYSSVLLRAIQRAEEVCGKTDQAGRAESAGGTADGALSNLRFIRMDARDLEMIFAPGEVDQIYLHFSDPWPKARHADRRLTSLLFLRRYEKILAPGGFVVFKTDNTELFAFSLEEIAAAGWALREETWDLHGAGADGEMEQPAREAVVMTEYEARFVAEGKPICRLVAAPS